MTLYTTIHYPDTCSCGYEYSWDDKQSNPKHTLVRMVQVCPEHTKLDTPEAQYEAVLEENTTKSFARAEILDVAPELEQQMDEVYLSFGNYVGKGRSIHLKIPQLTAARRSIINERLNLKFGVGKVVLD